MVKIYLLLFTGILLLFGSKEIPKLARTFGKGMKEFKRATDDIKREFENSTPEVMEDFKVSMKNVCVYAGKAILTSVIQSGNTITCEASISGDWLDKQSSQSERETEVHRPGSIVFFGARSLILNKCNVKTECLYQFQTSNQCGRQCHKAEVRWQQQPDKN